jgi:hypothetical protein
MSLLETLTGSINALISKLGFGGSATPALEPPKSDGTGPLNEFLRDRKERFLRDIASGNQDWIVVTGNEAGGL